MIDRNQVQTLINDAVQRKLGALTIDALSGEAHMVVMQARIEELEQQLAEAQSPKPIAPQSTRRR